MTRGRPKAAAATVDPRVERSNRYHAYMRGWKDGTSARAKKPEYKGHRLEQLYEQGYSAGLDAVAREARVAEERFGYRPSVLREGEPGAPP